MAHPYKRINVMLKKIVAILLLLTACAGCAGLPGEPAAANGGSDGIPDNGMGDVSGETTVAATTAPEYDEKAGTVTWYADLTHAGDVITNNKIVVDFKGKVEGVIRYQIFVYTETGELIYSDVLAPMHSYSFLLYEEKDGKPYIMKWRPDIWMGVLYIEYEIFSFDADGNKVTFDKDVFFYQFQYDGYELDLRDYPTDETISFAAKVNDYLKNSFVLLDKSIYDEAVYSTPGNLLTQEYIIPTFN